MFQSHGSPASHFFRRRADEHELIGFVALGSVLLAEPLHRCEDERVHPDALAGTVAVEFGEPGFQGGPIGFAQPLNFVEFFFREERGERERRSTRWPLHGLERHPENILVDDQPLELRPVGQRDHIGGPNASGPNRSLCDGHPVDDEHDHSEEDAHSGFAWSGVRSG